MTVPSITYRRGIRFPLTKEPAASRGIDTLRSIEKVYIPLAYGETRVCRPSLGTYEAVMRGQLLGTPEEPEDSPAVATVSGVFSQVQSL